VVGHNQHANVGAQAMVQKKKQDVSLPSLSPLPAPLAELSKDEMRERQRLHVKRTYYRKLVRKLVIVSIMLPCLTFYCWTLP
jgi:hypothetical protein